MFPSVTKKNFHARAYILDSRSRSKIKNNEVQKWRMALASYSNKIKRRPGKQNFGPDILSRAFWANLTESSLLVNIHNGLLSPRCHEDASFCENK